jgi:hypothetical protein
VADIMQQPNIIHEVQMQKTIVLRMQQKQEENIDGSITQRSAETGLQNTIEVRATALDPKADLNARAKKGF